MVSLDERVEAHAPYSVPFVSADVVLGIVTCLFIALLVIFSIYRQAPPAAVPASAPPLEFSSGRAMKHLEVIAQRPHPMGSLEHSAVRDYIFKELEAADLRPEMQTTTGVDSEADGRNRAGTTQNIIARLPGAASTKSLLFVGHYDSVPTGPGASDDGAAVVMMLETLRALKAGAPLQNDVVFLFSDGEEAALLGAHAFAAEHPLAKDVGLVLNFEARGNSGPAIMFETSEQNGWLIKEFAKVAPHPISHSLAYEIYRLLPNDTDLTVFKKAGLPGLNFAYIDGLARYHTQLDNLGEIDERSLQHHGAYALALARHFGGLNLHNIRQTNAVYFDVAGLTLVHYSTAWVLPLTFAVAVLFCGLILLGLRRGRLTPSGLALGAGAFVLSLIIAPAFVTLLWSLIQRFQEVPGVRPQGEAYNNDLYLLSFVAFTTGVVSALYILFRRKLGVENLTAGSLLCWLLLSVLAAVFLPGASYLLTWPLLFSLPALGYMVAAKEQRPGSRKLPLLLLAGAAPGIILLAPVIYQTFIGLTLNFVWVVIAMVVLLLGLLVPHLRIMSASNKWLLPGAATLAGIAFVVFAAAASGYSARHPKSDTMLYELNADTGQAIWASSDSKVDDWTRQFLSVGMPRRPLPELFSAATLRPFWQSPAPSESAEPPPAPNIRLLADDVQDGVRNLRLRITSTRQAPVLSVYLDSAAEVVASSVNGKPTAAGSAPASSDLHNQWELRYYAVPQDGIEITLALKATQPVKLRVVDQTYGLPRSPGDPWKARPADFIPAPLPYNDSTFVSKSFVF